MTELAPLRVVDEEYIKESARIVKLLVPFNYYYAHVSDYYDHRYAERKEAEEPTQRGVVYFIRSNGFIKVGRTTNFYNRLAKLQTGSPHELEVLLTVPGGSALEAEIHQDLKEHHHRGEWFRETPDVLAYIRGLDD